MLQTSAFCQNQLVSPCCPVFELWLVLAILNFLVFWTMTVHASSRRMFYKHRKMLGSVFTSPHPADPTIPSTQKWQSQETSLLGLGKQTQYKMLAENFFSQSSVAENCCDFFSPVLYSSKSVLYFYELWRCTAFQLKDNILKSILRGTVFKKSLLSQAPRN